MVPGWAETRNRTVRISRLHGRNGLCCCGYGNLRQVRFYRRKMPHEGARRNCRASRRIISKNIPWFVCTVDNRSHNMLVTNASNRQRLIKRNRLDKTQRGNTIITESSLRRRRLKDSAGLSFKRLMDFTKSYLAVCFPADDFKRPH